MKVAFQMDPLAGLNLAGDTTLALIREGWRRGYDLYHYQVDTLSFGNDGVQPPADGDEPDRRTSGKVQALVRRLSPSDGFDEALPGTIDNYQESEGVITALAIFDLIFVRQDPPFDMSYITATHVLDQLSDKVIVTNDPTSIRNFPEKIAVMEFGDLMPPTLISRDQQAIEAFKHQHGDIVMKPLYGNGGRGVFLVRRGDENFVPFIEILSADSREPWVSQKFVKGISHGDKRIILIDGEYCGAINRMPLAGQIRSNMAVGGKATISELTGREQYICDRLGKFLRDNALIFAGIDVIDGMITEINVTSPTGVMAIAQNSSFNPCRALWNSLEKKHLAKKLQRGGKSFSN